MSRPEYSAAFLPQMLSQTTACCSIFKGTDAFDILQEHKARLALYEAAVVDGVDTREGQALSVLMST